MLTKSELEHILTALIRMEDEITGVLTPDEYWAVIALAREVEAPQFIGEYFARKANQTKE